MTADGRHTNLLRNERPANDNERTPDTESNGNLVAGTARPLAALAVWADLPESLPILTAEIELIEACFADLIREIIANDNEPQ